MYMAGMMVTGIICVCTQGQVLINAVLVLIMLI
jgi:hypothetical protein